MFTGIIEELGSVRSVDERDGVLRLDIAASHVVSDAQTGDSIAVNGVCLTAVELDHHGFRADVMAESLEKTTLGSLAAGSDVNLERPMKLGGRLDGHMVQGHVDGVGTVAEITKRADGYRVRIGLPDDLARFVVDKGSITVDGVSLTVSDLEDDVFEIALIPHTLEVTTLGGLAAGDQVNLEVDVIAKYVARNMRAGSEDHA